MVNIGTFLKISDNSGAITGLCINILRHTCKLGALPGQLLTIVVKKNRFKKHIIKKSLIIIKGKIYRALLIRSIKGFKRWGNFVIHSGLNAVILLNQYKTPYATRLIGPVFREVRLTVIFRKIISMANITL